MTETKSVIVYGAGVSGRGAAEVLARHGKQVFLYNDSECKIEDSLAQALATNGGALVCGDFAKLLGSAELLVLSPGVPCDNENVLLAEEKGVEVIIVEPNPNRRKDDVHEPDQGTETPESDS